MFEEKSFLKAVIKDTASVEKSLAILFKRYEYSNTSLILHWCTKDHGIVKTIAKGANKAGSKLFGKLDLYRELEIEWFGNADLDLKTLKTANVIEAEESVMSYESLLGADYFSKIIDACNEPQIPIPNWYDLLKRAFAYLRENGINEKALIHFEKETAKLHGVWAMGTNPFDELKGSTSWFPHKERAELLKYVG